MSMASDISTISSSLNAIKNAIIDKGVTPSGDITTYADAISNIAGSGSSIKYSCNINNLLGDVNVNGILQLPVGVNGDITFDDIKDISEKALAYKFYENTNLTSSINFNDLEAISGNDACISCFEGTNISAVYFPKLKSISGWGACSRMFYGSKLVSISFPELESITGQSACCERLLSGCTQLETAYFSKLHTITGNYALRYAFNYNCKKLSNIYFNALTTTSFGNYTNQFTGMFGSETALTSGTCTIHFPSNLESTIQGLTGYPLFGGTSGYVILAFDLPATS